MTYGFALDNLFNYLKGYGKVCGDLGKPLHGAQQVHRERDDDGSLGQVLLDAALGFAGALYVRLMQPDEIRKHDAFGGMLSPKVDQRGLSQFPE